MSQVKVRLPDAYSDCPLAYLNMLEYLRTDEDEGWKYSNNLANIKRELRNSNGRYCIESDTIIFPSEADYTNWRLRWE